MPDFIGDLYFCDSGERHVRGLLIPWGSKLLSGTGLGWICDLLRWLAGKLGIVFEHGYVFFLPVSNPVMPADVIL